MTVVQLRADIAHRLANISDFVFLEEISKMLDFNESETIFRCTAEQREAIAQAQQSIAQGDYVSESEMNQTVQVWASANPKTLNLKSIVEQDSNEF